MFYIGYRLVFRFKKEYRRRLKEYRKRCEKESRYEFINTLHIFLYREPDKNNIIIGRFLGVIIMIGAIFMFCTVIFRGLV